MCWSMLAECSSVRDDAVAPIGKHQVISVRLEAPGWNVQAIVAGDEVRKVHVTPPPIRMVRVSLVPKFVSFS